MFPAFWFISGMNMIEFLVIDIVVKNNIERTSPISESCEDHVFYTKFSFVCEESEANLEPCQISMIKFFVKIVNEGC